MRVVGPGHQFHPETGLCRRCGLPMSDSKAEFPCAKASLQTAPRTRGAPDIYGASLPKDK